MPSMSKVGSVSAALVRHERQDIVARAVHDAVDGLDPVRRKPFFERLEDRDAAGNGRLVPHGHARLVRGRVDLLAVHGQERLVRGDDVLFVLDGLKDELLGRLVAADELNHDVDVRVG
ncbi:MAG: hypothetical protein H6Q98_317, partial [Nitrospirae bacterium]|nr:hypothetical protein [Nitrospirota bacterium]